ncbi:TIGR00730 family Rossman fold protein [Maridesulfovibrio zosterae]|uniref:LOG family protein n=1 Tax=Maridesulfovibrio zosterae TaxID=82171 RepID=UPI0004009081|nr:TIGR00730 family Rossman fold protein [Maridesulfovibrio zosterae]
MKSICVFLGANPGNDPKYAQTARNMGRELAKRNIRIIYGGSNMGLMGILAESALEAGGEVVGVIPESLVKKEVAHYGLTKLHIAESMHERKALMAELSDGFVALPGGIGTMDEIFEIFTWAQLGFHNKPCGLLNIDGYYDKLIEFLGGVVQEGFLGEIHKEMLITASSPSELIEAYSNYEAPTVSKWVEKISVQTDKRQ